MCGRILITTPGIRVLVRTLALGVPPAAAIEAHTERGRGRSARVPAGAGLNTARNR